MPATINLFGTEDSLLSEPVKRTMESLHELFSQAPVLGSLIDPSRLRVHFSQPDFKTVAPLLSAVLQAENATEEARERIIAAAGMVKAATLLAGKYSLVVTNVPYLGRGKQAEVLATYCAEHYPDAKADLATCFLERSLDLTAPCGSAAIVAPCYWLFLNKYTRLRNLILEETSFNFLSRLGVGAFETISGEMVNVCLVCLTAENSKKDLKYFGMDLADNTGPDAKASALRIKPGTHVSQNSQKLNPDSTISIEEPTEVRRLGNYIGSYHGITTTDYLRFGRAFWESYSWSSEWVFQQGTVPSTRPHGGRENVLFWERGRGGIKELQSQGSTVVITGLEAWGRKGVVINRMNQLFSTLYTGEAFDTAVAVLVPKDESVLPALWAFCSSPEFYRTIRQFNQQVVVEYVYYPKVPFDVQHWKQVAKEMFPSGIPNPHSDDATQWLFNGHPFGSDVPLQVAVARLVGYQWPRQTGSSFTDCPALGPDGLEIYAAEDGIVPLSSIAGEASAADRLRALLTAAYGDEWSAAKLAQLLGKAPSLEDWLRDSFFEEHCQLFHQRPFVWHVWDGRKDGFHALVNYHKLAAPNAEGRKTLEKLIYTTLGDWIVRQRADVTAGVGWRRWPARRRRTPEELSSKRSCKAPHPTTSSSAGSHSTSSRSAGSPTSTMACV
jgi:hypothetical protein